MADVGCQLTLFIMYSLLYVSCQGICISGIVSIHFLHCATCRVYPGVISPFKHHRGWSTAQKDGQNPFPYLYFFVQINSFLLISNKNLSFFPFKHEFFPFKHHIEVGQKHKNMGKILLNLAVLFLASNYTFFVPSISSF